MFSLHGVEANPAFLPALFNLRKRLVHHELNILVTEYYELYMPKEDAFALRFAKMASSSAPLVVPHILSFIFFESLLFTNSEIT